ncbi:5-aminolevulinate synthase [Pseudoroseicyclus sp. H15]
MNSFFQPGQGWVLPLAIGAALAYALATAGMKLAAGGQVGFAYPLVIICLIAAAAIEITLLRQTELSVIYISIIALETIVVLGYAHVMGEPLSLRQLAGAGLVLGGLVITTV